MTKSSLVFWSPRVLCILAILFVSILALDAFDPKLTLWRQFSGFLIHMIPSFTLALLLAVAWKWELAGGIIFAAIGIGLSPVLFIHNFRMNHSVWWSLLVIVTITIPFLLVGCLFIFSHIRRKKNPVV